MNRTSDQTKLVESAIKQNLLLWQLTTSFIDIDNTLDRILDSTNVRSHVNKVL